jgi:hypothetical protein
MKYGWPVIILLLLFSCKKQKVIVDYRLDTEQLIQLMYDVQWSDAAIANLSPERKDSLRTLFWEKLTTIYGMTEEEIKNEIHKLESDPETMKLVFDRIKEMSDTIK